MRAAFLPRFLVVPDLIDHVLAGADMLVAVDRAPIMRAFAVIRRIGQVVFRAACGGTISARARTTHLNDAVEAFLKMYERKSG